MNKYISKYFDNYETLKHENIQLKNNIDENIKKMNEALYEHYTINLSYIKALIQSKTKLPFDMTVGREDGWIRYYIVIENGYFPNDLERSHWLHRLSNSLIDILNDKGDSPTINKAKKKEFIQKYKKKKLQQWLSEIINFFDVKDKVQANYTKYKVEFYFTYYNMEEMEKEE